MTRHGEVPPFDLRADLPEGTTLLEASAGTGKTFTIAALATRYVAEGRTTIDQLLMITFGRSATRELRERVREALTRARDALRGPESAGSHPDPVIRSLALLPPADRALAAERLSRATADFDSATIATTHQFCLSMLAELGIAADTDPGQTFVEDLSELVDQVVDDLYVRKYVSARGERLPLAEARQLARSVVADPQSHLVEGPTTPGSLAETRVRFARAVRAEVLTRRRRDRLVTFDDLVQRLAAAVSDPSSGERAARRLRRRFQVVLVDEFQDTDPAQWSILRRAFHGHRTLVLIGDPKQAIYAFRGADVFSYLAAAGHADRHATLPVNHRSDAAVVRGVTDLMGGLRLGDEHIVVHGVGASHEQPRLLGPATAARVRLRTWHPADGELSPVGPPRAAVSADVAADIVALLSGTTRVQRGQGPHAAWRRVSPGDIAVLVWTHAQAAAVRAALGGCGVPAVVAAATSIFATRAASEWLTLLEAMHQPRAALVRAAALTDFLGWRAADLVGDRVDQEVGLTLRAWAETVDSDGVAALMARMSQRSGLAERVLAHEGGERHLTDLRHVAEALHVQQRSTGADVAGMVAWLRARVRRAAQRDRESAPELTRRLETDAEAVQVLTVHASKGLEFPIAYVPFAWDRFSRSPDLLTCHDEVGRRILDVRGPGAPGRDAHVAAQRQEEAGESLRLLYVALTRASSLVVVHWASSKQNTREAPLHRVLCARREHHTLPEPGYPVHGPPTQGIAASAWIDIEEMGERASGARWTPARTSAPTLAAAPYTRVPDPTWRRTSYTGLTSAAHGPEHAPSGVRSDEPPGAELPPVGDTPSQGGAAPQVESAFADLPAGATFGTLVHGVLETVDPGAPDLDSEVLARCRQLLLRQPMEGLGPERLAPAIAAAMRTPLGPLTGQRSLAGIPRADRLAELDFELPMGSQDAGAGSSSSRLADVADLLRKHLGAADPLAGYADHLVAAGLGPATLHGYLAGSIDAVLRVPRGRDSSFVVVDYKTNLLRSPTAPGMERLAWGYRPEVLPAAMIASHYPLQALLYCAALHRYLRWRVTGYQPARHLAGVLYLFLRGMTGPAAPTQAGIACGVFSWQPPVPLIVELSDLLDGRRP